MSKPPLTVHPVIPSMILVVSPFIVVEGLFPSHPRAGTFFQRPIPIHGRSIRPEIFSREGQSIHGRQDGVGVQYLKGPQPIHLLAKVIEDMGDVDLPRDFSSTVD